MKIFSKIRKYNNILKTILEDKKMKRKERDSDNDTDKYNMKKWTAITVIQHDLARKGRTNENSVKYFLERC